MLSEDKDELARTDDLAGSPDALGDPHWFLENYDVQKQTLTFVRASRSELAARPFLDHRWQRGGQERCELALDVARARMPEHAPRPKLNFIWHTSFCCSTLIAEALDLPGCNLSLREPLALVSAADAKRQAIWTNTPTPPRLSEIVFRLLARPTGEQVTVKPSNFANILVEDAIAETTGNALFLYADIESFLISIEKGGDPLRKYGRRLFGSLAADNQTALPLPPQQIFQLSDLEIAALSWHLQMAHFRRMAKALGRARAACLDCAAFLADPAAALWALDRFFGLGLGAEHIAGVVAGPLLKRHAKNPHHPFDARRRQVESDDLRKRLGRDLQRIVDWSYGLCPDSARKDPLPGALVG